jgi:hypothetical protein
MAADRVIRWTTAVAVIGVAAVAAVASYEHAYDLVRANGEGAWAARLVPLTVDGRLHVGQPRAQRVRADLAALNGAQAGVPLEDPAAIPAIPSAA